MSESKTLPIAKSRDIFGISSRMANRHGLIAGATGTGKTVTLQVLAEQFSSIGTPVFMADVKGDLSGMAKSGAMSPRMQERLDKMGVGAPAFQGFPVCFWDVFGKDGHPVRTTVSEMGPMLLGRLLNLNETQAGVLSIIFKIADDEGLLMLDLKDLRSMLEFVGKNAGEFTTEYGNVSAASVGAIQRALLTIEQEGGDQFFGEPALHIEDLMRTEGGKGVINILAADRLMQSPRVYSTFLLWMLSELFEVLPETGDADKPKMVFFFDEAHLLFNEAPKALVEKIEQVVRLIRSKGVGIYFISQNPLDIPETVLGQLGNRVQHALRAFTPRDQKAVKTAAETFRQNPAFKTEAAITEMGVGEALVSFLDEKGVPAMVERAMIMPPMSQIGPITPQERADILNRSSMKSTYDKTLDRESAYEILQKQQAAAEKRQREEEEALAREKEDRRAERESTRSSRSYDDGHYRSRGTARAPAKRKTDTIMQRAAKSAASSVGRSVGTAIVRGILGSFFGK